MSVAPLPATPLEATLELRPTTRLDIIDVSRRLAENCGDLLFRYPRALYFSYHTTAGYVDPRLSARLDHDRERIRTFFEAFQRLFPPNAGYRHDELHLRTELSEAQRCCEPRNGDSHLTFIGAGLTSCVSVDRPAAQPVWFADLDGINGNQQRRRQTTVLGYHREQKVATIQMAIPVSRHAVASVNLKDPRLGFIDELREALARFEIAKGRIDIALRPDELHAGLTVNEYETLLMKRDLAEVLKNPLQYMVEKGKHMIRDPRAIPSKTINYAKYDVVQVLNEVMDILGMSESLVERIVNRLMAVPAARFLRMKRSISLPVFDRDPPGHGTIVEGTYQSPILVQWRKAEGRARQVDVTFVRFA
ncbi:MAG: hypothetical protein HY704_09680 [Gemmatimonadetes bacterium]|nr:hypothetical protein [Gemmatimonadota bacterium]